MCNRRLWKMGRGMILVVGLLACFEAGAGPISWFKRSWMWPFGWPDTLVVAGNYAEPRLLAEVTQSKTKQPVILISVEATGDRVFYLPYKSDEVLEIPVEQYTEFIETMLRPKRIVFLGDDKMLPRKYVEPVRKNYSAIILEGDNWISNAKQMGKIVNTWSLKRAYKKADKKLMQAKSHREAYDPQGKTILLPPSR